MYGQIIKQDALEKYEDMKKQRNSLIEDTVLLRANNERLEREHEKLKSVKEDLTNRVRKLDLHLQIQHDELMSSDEEVRYWKDKYTALTNHIRTKAENNPGVSRYIDLVNYIDRLEQK